MPDSAGKRLVETIIKQLERIDYFSSTENNSPNLAVHEMRKSFKRLRALLRFYKAFPQEFSPEYSIQIKYFGRSLTEIRESFVNLYLFERITTDSSMLHERKIKFAREKLTEKNHEVIEQQIFAFEGYLPIQKFVKSLSQQMEDNAVPVPAVYQFIAELEYSYQKAFLIYQNLSIQSDPEILHELRKSLKQLYYQFDFIRYVHPRFFRLKTFQLNNITEQLGEDHDLFVFLTEMLETQYGFNQEELEILENQIQHLRELNRIKLFPRLKQFFTESPEVFNLKLQGIFKVPVI
jgi:CHAD domain-containing protein